MAHIKMGKMLTREVGQVFCLRRRCAPCSRWPNFSPKVAGCWWGENECNLYLSAGSLFCFWASFVVFSLFCIKSLWQA